MASRFVSLCEDLGGCAHRFPLLAGALVIMCATLHAQINLPNGVQIPSNYLDPRQPSQIPSEPVYIAAPVLPIDNGRQLFVDNFLIESTTLSRVLHRPVPFAGNPILTPGPDDGGVSMPFSDGVWFDPQDKLYKLFYWCRFSALCLATSIDGKTFIRPIFPNAGFPNSNIVLLTGGGRDSGTVWMDLADTNPDRKFKAFIYTGGNRLSVYYSPDGVRWTQQALTIPSLSDRTTIFFNPWRSKWVESIRSSGVLPAAPSRPSYSSRHRSYSESSDLLTWNPLQGTRFWVGPDENDPPYPGPYGVHYPQLYNLDAVAYESIFVGLFSMYYPSPGPEVVELNAGFSRDGLQWSRPMRGAGPGGAFIAATNQDGDWNGFNTQSAGGGFIVAGDELWFYFSGRNARHGIVPTQLATGLATMRRDGFASMQAGASEGVLTTKPVRFSGQQLFVNVANPSGSLRAEVLDANQNVIGTFTKTNSVPVTANKTMQAMKWTGANLASLAGQTVRFRFYLTNGALYSFWVGTAAGASAGSVAGGGPGFASALDMAGALTVVSDDSISPTLAVAIQPAGPMKQIGLLLDTNEAAMCGYSTSSAAAFGAMTKMASTGSTRHAQALSNLPAGSNMFYMRCRDQAGNESSMVSTTIVVEGDAPVTPPLELSGLTATPTGPTTATIGWSTNGEATAQVFYGTTTAYGSATALHPAATGVSTHSFNLDSLAPGTTYYVRAVGTRDGLTRELTTTFQTLKGPLVFSGVATSAITNTSATIGWTTNRSTDTVIHYGTTTSYGQTLAGPAGFTGSHTLVLTNLTPGTAYYAKIAAREQDGDTSSYEGITFSTIATIGPVVISGIQVLGLTSSSATVTWNTSLPSTDVLSFGHTLSFRTGTITTTNPSTSHSIALTGLTPNTTFYVRIQSTDQNGGVALVQDITFATPNTPLLFTNATAYAIQNTSMFVDWRTSREASMVVSYGTTPLYGSTVNLPVLRYSSYAAIAGLIPGTQYYMRLQATDATGATAEYLLTFNTTGVAPTGGSSVTPPALTLTGVASDTISQTGATVRWTTSVAAKRFVRYGTTPAVALSTIEQTTLITSHAVALSGLTPGTLYYYQAVSTDALSRTVTSPVMSFSTTAALPPALQLTNVQAGSITQTSALISWTTNVAANERVLFGLTPSPATGTAVGATLVTSHSMSLTGLTAGTTYYYQALSVDGTNTSASSPVLSFTTLPAASLLPPTGYTLVAAPIAVAKSGTVTIQWTAPAGSSISDWLGLYLVGGNNREYRWYSFTRGATSGSFTVTVPPVAGQYEFRYLINNAYTSVAASNSISVGP